MQKSTRRKFIAASGSFGLGLMGVIYFSGEFPRSKWGTFVGGGRGVQEGQDIFFLALVDVDKKKTKYLRTEFLPHGVTAHPSDPFRVAVFEKKGPGACELDLKKGRLIRKIETSPDRYFYGHGVYDRWGEVLFATETVFKTGRGVVVIRDSQTMKTLGEFPSYGFNPHDCQLIKGGEVIVITNAGGTMQSGHKPCVTYVDVRSQKLLEKFEMEKESFNTGHFSISDSGELVVVSAPREGLSENSLGAISTLSSSGDLKLMEGPSEILEGLRSETLSVCINNKNDTFVATSPKGNQLVIGNLKSQRIIKSLELDNPRGVALTEDQTHFIVSYGANGNVLLIDSTSFEIKKDSVMERLGLTGSHLFNLPS